MNKMTKGALATGLGVALLIGGGGTLAVWNDTTSANAGTIVAGDLQIAAGKGQWKNAADKDIEIGDYKVVPGDTLTFTQDVTVTLVGDLMKAELTFTDFSDKSDDYFVVSNTTLTDEDGNVVTPTQKSPLTPAEAGDYTATVTVQFPESITAEESKNSTLALGTMAFTLDQLAP